MTFSTSAAPGVGSGWDRLAASLAEAVPPAEIDKAWAFRVVRRDGQDFGTAIVSRIDGGRRRIYTAGFVHTVKGKTRGKYEWFLDEVGSGPVEALDELLALVPKRSEEEEPPAPVELAHWFPLQLPLDDGPAVAG
ncbi:MAG: hypothetical protein HOP28_17670 [Gemmatimonadales bacterium]|nr:hypothetical protein [Gemmatimonadales bacterium]